MHVSITETKKNDKSEALNKKQKYETYANSRIWASLKI